MDVMTILDLVADLVRALQRVVDAIPDGVLVPLTIAAVQKAQRGNGAAA